MPRVKGLQGTWSRGMPISQVWAIAIISFHTWHWKLPWKMWKVDGVFKKEHILDIMQSSEGRKWPTYFLCFLGLSSVHGRYSINPLWTRTNTTSLICKEHFLLQVRQRLWVVRSWQGVQRWQSNDGLKRSFEKETKLRWCILGLLAQLLKMSQQIQDQLQLPIKQMK